MVTDNLLEKSEDRDRRGGAFGHKHCQVFEERLLGLDRLELDHLCELGHAAVERFLVVGLGVFDDLPEVVADLRAEIRGFATAAEHRQDVELLNSEFHCGRLRDLLEEELDLGLAKVVFAVVQDFENLKLVVTLGQVPELGKELLAQEVLLKEAAEDVPRALHKLDMSLLWVPDKVEHVVIDNPIDDRLRLLAGSTVHGVLDDAVEIFDSYDSFLQKLRLEALFDKLKLEDLCLVSGLRLRHQALLDLLDSRDGLLGAVSLELANL